MALRIVQPEGWPRPRGYSNGILADGRHLHVAGQVGWDASGRFPLGFAAQFEAALENFLEVVRAAGGGPQQVARLTIYVTDLARYRESQAELGEIWRRQMGRHYPAMALVGVAGLVEPDALVEIEGVAVL
ncbi:MAG: RidA family protein [Deltaproteobacteria bacterium]|nr:MAG: RidA family protein [Deltaproteobacteria bacterium]